MNHQGLIASSNKPYSEAGSVLLPPPSACPVFFPFFKALSIALGGVGGNEVRRGCSTPWVLGPCQAEGLVPRVGADSGKGARGCESWKWFIAFLFLLGAGAEGVETHG